MEQLPNGFTLNLPEGAFPLSTDSMVLSHFVRLPKNARVLDLGSGCGTLGLLLCAVNESCRVTGVELSQSAHLAAIDNIRRNGLTTRMESICVDVRQVPGSFPPGSFDVCVSNPPYFSGGPASRTAALARREDACSPADLFSTRHSRLGAEIRRRLFPRPPSGTAGRADRPGFGGQSGSQAAVPCAPSGGFPGESCPASAAQGRKARS